MFDKMKQMYDLQKKARAIKKELENMALDIEESGGKLKITMNGEYKLVNVSIDPYFLNPDRKVELEHALKRVISNGVGQMQVKSAARMQEMSKELGLPNIPGM